MIPKCNKYLKNQIEVLKKNINFGECKGKNLLELSWSSGHLGNEFNKLGLDVFCKKPICNIIKEIKLYPKLKFIDINLQLKNTNNYDFIICWDYVNYFNSIENIIEIISNKCQILILELGVIDSDKDNYYLEINDSVGNKRIIPSQKNIENILENNNFTYKLINDKKLNTTYKKYDWKIKNSNKFNESYRSLYICFNKNKKIINDSKMNDIKEKKEIKKEISKKNYISPKGYSIYKSSLSEDELVNLKKKMTVKPFVNKNFGQDVKPFKIYKESKKKIYIPKFYGLKNYGDPEYDNMYDGLDINIEFISELREKQKPAVEKFLEETSKTGGGIISVPCGFGKTVLSLYLVSKLKKKTLVIVHKEFLMNQWIERIEFFLPDAKIGRLQGNKIQVEDKDIVIGMLQSISMREYEDDIFKQFGFVIYDECHHLGAEVFSRSLMKVPCKYTLGLSATPDRSDGLTKVFKWFLGDIVYLIKNREKEDVIVNIIRYYNEDEKYSKVICNYKGQINMPNMITNICLFENRNDLIINKLKDCINEKRRILILSDRREHLKILKNKIEELKMCTSGYYLGGLKQEELKKTEEKDVMLGTFSMASEGFDCKELDTIILASPKSNIEQAVGRILRKKKEDREKIPLIIDIIDDFNIFSKQGEKRHKFYKKNSYEINIENIN